MTDTFYKFTTRPELTNKQVDNNATKLSKNRRLASLQAPSLGCNRPSWTSTVQGTAPQHDVLIGKRPLEAAATERVHDIT